MFLRILLGLGVIVALWWFVRPRPRVPAPERAAGTRPLPVAPMLEEMVHCAHCGVHLPASEALRGDAAHVYCSPAHRLAGPSRGR